MQLVEFLQAHATPLVVRTHRLAGSPKAVANARSRVVLLAALASYSEV